MRYVLPVAILAGTLVYSCSPQRSMDETSPRPAARERDGLAPEEAVFEAVFRYQIEHYPLSNFPSAHIHCVSLPGATDPTPALLARLNASGETRKISDCQVNSEVKETSTGYRGIVLKVDRIRELNDSEALVEGGYYYDALGARADVYHLTRGTAGWVVQRAELRSIS